MGALGAVRWSAALGLALLAAGCGGGGSLSSADYSQRLNEACASHRERVQALGRPSIVAFMRPVAELTIFSDASEAELAEVLQRSRELKAALPGLQDSVQQLIDETKGLHPPPDGSAVDDAAEEWPDFLRRLKLSLEWLRGGTDTGNARVIYSAAESLLGDLVSAHYLIDRIPAPACTPEPL